MLHIINDCHLGAKRQAGTTPESQKALTEHIRSEFVRLVNMAPEGAHIAINGDLFDSFTVDPNEVVFAYETLSDWLHKSGGGLTLCAGNHDWAPRGDKLSSFHLLAHFLQARWFGTVDIIDYRDGLDCIYPGVWVIPHMPNQEQFNIEIEKVFDEHPGVLLLHANYANEFAEHADHSLNVHEETAQRLVKEGWQLVFGHEHQMRKALDGKVVIPGCQICTSIADHLGCDTKYATLIHDDGRIELTTFNKVSDNFAEIDWQHLADTPADLKFIRVAGKATSEQAAEVVGAIDGLRRTHSAYVISNAVSIDGISEFGELTSVTFEDVTKFDVMGLLMEEFSDKERDVLRSLL